MEIHVIAILSPKFWGSIIHTYIFVSLLSLRSLSFTSRGPQINLGPLLSYFRSSAFEGLALATTSYLRRNSNMYFLQTYLFEEHTFEKHDFERVEENRRAIQEGD